MLLTRQPLPVESPLIPAAEYSAELSDVSEYENAFGHRLSFHFTITEGMLSGSIVERRTTASFTPRSKLGEMIAELLGRSLTERDMQSGIDLEQLIGTVCRVSVTHKIDRSGTPYCEVDHVSVSSNPALNGQQRQKGHAGNVINR